MISFPINEEQFSEKEKKKNPSKRLLTKWNTNVSLLIFVVEQITLIPLKNFFLKLQNKTMLRRNFGSLRKHLL